MDMMRPDSAAAPMFFFFFFFSSFLFYIACSVQFINIAAAPQPPHPGALSGVGLGPFPLPSRPIQICLLGPSPLPTHACVSPLLSASRRALRHATHLASPPCFQSRTITPNNSPPVPDAITHASSHLCSSFLQCCDCSFPLSQRRNCASATLHLDSALSRRLGPCLLPCLLYCNHTFPCSSFSLCCARFLHGSILHPDITCKIHLMSTACRLSKYLL